MTRPQLTSVLAFTILQLCLSVACSGDPQLAVTELLEARRLAQELLVQFTKASDATNRAVLADTDETSIVYAHEAEQQRQVVESDMAALDKIVRRLDYTQELDSLHAFHTAFDHYVELDQQILKLAVENTNLKAARLSFGPAYEAATTFQAALDGAARAVTSKNACDVRVLTLQASLAVRELEVLQAQHIAESKDDVMSELEHKMGALEADARTALSELAALHRAELQPGLDAANAALTTCMSTHAQLILLSRRNSNLRSQALALGPKPQLTAACDESLRTLNEQLGHRKFMATR